MAGRCFPRIGRAARIDPVATKTASKDGASHRQTVPSPSAPEQSVRSCQLMLRITASLAGWTILGGCLLSVLAVAADPGGSPVGRFAGGIFKWTDSRGGVHYSDRPPTAQDLKPTEPEPSPFEGRPDIASPVPSPSGPLSSPEPLHSVEAARAPGEAADSFTTVPPTEEPASDIAAGMTEKHVQEIWGRPDRIRTLFTAEGFVERWIYDEGPSVSQHIDFLRGRVISVAGPDLSLQGAPLDLPTD